MVRIPSEIDLYAPASFVDLAIILVLSTQIGLVNIEVKIPAIEELAK